MYAALSIVLVVGVMIVREVVRWCFVPRGAYRLRALIELRTPGSNVRRAFAIVAGFAAIYLAVAAIAFVHARRHGIASGPAHYVVADLVAGSAAAGKLERGDVIDALDGEHVVPRRGPSLSERIRAKGGAPVSLQIRRAGTPATIVIQPAATTDPAGQPTWLIGIHLATAYPRDTSAETATRYALAFPIEHATSFVRALVRMFRGTDEPEVGGVVRLVEEFQQQQASAELVFMVALYYAGHLLLLALLLDLLRLFVLIRDRLQP